MMGGFVAAAAPFVVAVILSLSNDNWAITFYVSAGIYFMGTFFWLFLDPTTSTQSHWGANSRTACWRFVVA